MKKDCKIITESQIFWNFQNRTPGTGLESHFSKSVVLGIKPNQTNLPETLSSVKLNFKGTLLTEIL